MKTTNLALLVTGLIVSTANAAVAQMPPPSKNIFVDINFGVQPSSREFSTEAFPVVYEEVAIVSSNQGVDASPYLDVMGGYRVWRDFSVALGLTTTMGAGGDAEVTGGIPHPLFYDRRVETDETLLDLSHREASVHLSAMWTSPVTDKIDASVFAGPSFIKLYQDVVTTVTVAVPTQSFTPVTESQTATTWGFHFGGEVTYLVTPRFGFGGTARFVTGSADLPSVVEDPSVGGFQLGGGFRVRF
jgi:hypothetical protein